MITDDLQTIIWQPTSQNAKGIYDQYNLGNGYESTLVFDEYGLPENISAGFVVGSLIGGAYGFHRGLKKNNHYGLDDLLRGQRTDYNLGNGGKFKRNGSRNSGWKFAFRQAISRVPGVRLLNENGVFHIEITQ